MQKTVSAEHLSFEEMVIMRSKEIKQNISTIVYPTYTFHGEPKQANSIIIGETPALLTSSPKPPLFSGGYGVRAGYTVSPPINSAV